MNITVSQEQGRVPVTVLHLEGLLNLGTADLLDKQIKQAHAMGARYFLIDLAGVASLTSAGLRTILAAAQMLGNDTRGKSPYLKLASPVPNVRQVLTIAGFDALMDVCATVPEAIAAF